MQSCCWKNTGRLLSAKKVIIICFRIFLLNRCLALTSLSRPPGKPSLKAFIFSRLPEQLCHKTANIIYYDVGLPLDPTGGIVCVQGPFCLQKDQKQNYSSKPTTLARGAVFLHLSLGGRQSQSQDIMLHLGHKLSDHGVCTKNLVQQAEQSPGYIYMSLRTLAKGKNPLKSGA